MTKKQITDLEIARKLEEMVYANDFALLNRFLSPSVVKKLGCTEKEKLAELFFERGALLAGREEGLEGLNEALRAFERSVKLDPKLAKGWVLYAQTKLKIAMIVDSEKLFSQTREHFLTAESLFESQQEEFPLFAVWDFAICLNAIAKKSGEASDYKCATDKYKVAYERGFREKEFLIDYGTALGELGILVGREELLLEATSYLEESIQLSTESASAWLRLACIYKILYQLSFEISFFERADQSFVAAARLNAEPVILWTNWGQLLALEGKTTRDSELLSSALDKLEKAEQASPDHPLILTTMADVLMHLGIIEDDFEMLKEAQHILELVTNDSFEMPDSVCLLGHCLINLGKYLSDSEPLVQAIHKFELGISRFPKSFRFWHGLAMAHLAKGELTQSVIEYEKAAKFTINAIELGGQVPAFYNDLGVALMKLGELEGDSSYIAQAVEKFEEAIHCFNRKSLGSPDPEWFYNYGCALDWLGDFELNPVYFERAIVILTRLLDQYPTFVYARYNLAMAYYHLGDAIGEVEPLEKSIEFFEMTLKEDEEDDGVLSDLGLAYLTLADIINETIPNQRSADAFKSAEHYLMKSIGLGSTRANYYMACLHSLQGRLPEAMQFLERAKLVRSLPSAQDLLEDEWLESLRQTPHFKAFVGELTEEN